MPSRGLGQLGRTYFVNMMVFQCWGLLYAIFQALMSALQITNPMQFNGSFLQAFVGSSQMIVMSVACVLLSIMVALIPFIASRIVRGDIGSTLMTVISGAMTAGAVASGLAFSGGGGLAAGRQAPSGGPPSPPSGGSAAVSQGSGVGGQGSGGVGQVQSSGGGTVTGDSRPPTPPSSDGVNATMSSASGAPSTGATPPSVPQNRNDSPSAAAQSASGYNGRSLAGFAAWQAGHAIGRTMRWAGMGAEQ
jgi:type IV secretory pathway TrbL component